MKYRNGSLKNEYQLLYMYSLNLITLKNGDFVESAKLKSTKYFKIREIKVARK